MSFNNPNDDGEQNSNQNQRGGEQMEPPRAAAKADVERAERRAVEEAERVHEELRSEIEALQEELEQHRRAFAVVNGALEVAIENISTPIGKSSPNWNSDNAIAAAAGNHEAVPPSEINE